jgi:hypothetical protein
MLDTVWQGVSIDTLYDWCAAPATPGSTCAAFLPATSGPDHS